MQTPARRRVIFKKNIQDALVLRQLARLDDLARAATRALLLRASGKGTPDAIIAPNCSGLSRTSDAASATDASGGGAASPPRGASTTLKPRSHSSSGFKAGRRMSSPRSATGSCAPQ
ncbi:MAG: hypothetical protein LC746_13440 [Acidobacteria bacterium]|nr:hypothetical protein [Acidobacteriota bacterium]